MNRYRTLVGPCDEFTITHDLHRQITTIHIRRGIHNARQVLTFVEQADCHVDLITLTLQRMVSDLVKLEHPIMSPPQDLDLTWDEYRSQFGHISSDPLDLVGKTLNHPAHGIRVRVVEANVTRDKVSARVEILS